MTSSRTDVGCAIEVTTGDAGAFPTEQAAYDVAVDLAHEAAVRWLRVACRASVGADKQPAKTGVNAP